MQHKTTTKLLVLCASTLLGTAAHADIADFEDVATPLAEPYFTFGVLSNYQGFNWATNCILPPVSGAAAVYQNSGGVASGYLTAIPSGARALFLPTSSDGFHELTVTRGTAWDFTSADFAGAWRTGLVLEFTGSLAGTQLYSSTVTLGAVGTLNTLALNFNGIDTLRIRSFGGTTAFPGENGYHLIVDNFTYTVPAPSAMALLAAAGLCRRRRR